LGGGFAKVDQTGGPLVVIYASDLESVQAKAREAGGNIEGEIRLEGAAFTFSTLNTIGCLSGPISRLRSERSAVHNARERRI